MSILWYLKETSMQNLVFKIKPHFTHDENVYQVLNALIFY